MTHNVMYTSHTVRCTYTSTIFKCYIVTCHCLVYYEYLCIYIYFLLIHLYYSSTFLLFSWELVSRVHLCVCVFESVLCLCPQGFVDGAKGAEGIQLTNDRENDGQSHGTECRLTLSLWCGDRIMSRTMTQHFV